LLPYLWRALFLFILLCSAGFYASLLGFPRSTSVPDYALGFFLGGRGFSPGVMVLQKWALAPEDSFFC
jgi:hypothetical protein